MMQFSNSSYIKKQKCQNLEKKKRKFTERKSIATQVKQRIKHMEFDQLWSKLQETERVENDSTKYFVTSEEFNNRKPKVNLCIRNKDNKIIVSEDQQIRIVSKYFQKMLSPEKTLII